MNNSIQIIPFANLAVAFIPAFVVIGIFIKWSMGFGSALYAVSRMLAQLLLVGYCLAFIFDTDSAWIVTAVLSVMVLTASWIALRTIKTRRSELYKYALCAILLGGGTTLLLVTQGVLNLKPWYLPRYLIPLAGMMTGQILSGISPLIAVRYQIMVMCMIFGAAGISAAAFLLLAKDPLMHTAGEGGSR